MRRTLLFPLIFTVLIVFTAACGSSVTETQIPTVIPSTDLPPTEAPPTAVIVISTQELPSAQDQTTEEASSVPTNLGVINYETIRQVEKLVAIPLANVIELEFSPNSRYLRMRIEGQRGTHEDIFMDMVAGTEAMSLVGNQRIYFNPNSTTIASLADNKLVEYDLSTGEATAGYNSEYDVAALSPDGKWLIVFEEIDYEGPGTTFQVVDIATEEVVHRIFVNAVIDKEDFVFHPKEEILAGTFSPERDVYVTTFWSMESGKAIHTLYGYSEIVFNPMGYEIAASKASENAISLIDMRTWEQKNYLGSAIKGPNYYHLEYTRFGGLLYALYDGIATYESFWRPEKAFKLSNFKYFGDLLDITISPACDLIATSDKEGYIMIWGIPE